jgi:hypothetical protein
MVWALKSVHGVCVRSKYTFSAFGAVMRSKTGRMVEAGHTSSRIPTLTSLGQWIDGARCNGSKPELLHIPMRVQQVQPIEAWHRGLLSPGPMYAQSKSRASTTG